MAVEFLLLGDIEAHLDGRRLALGHSRQRCVLAALLVDANRPVPVHQLADRVWGGCPPQRASGTLYSYLSRLRQVLAPADGVVIRRQPGGYVLTGDAMAVDLHRFHRLVGEARATQDHGQALVLLRRALGLWRSDAFAGLDTPWLNSVRDTLEVERHAAQLECNDLALERGEHAELLGGLCACAASHPLDERLAGQLMLALYRCGRQADALDHYEQVRRRLADELGADPSPGLRRLHQQMLMADAHVGVPDRAGAPAARHASPAALVPRQLPAPLPSFSGRDGERAQLTAMLERSPDHADPVIAVIGGAGGMGKTCLAVRWAHDHLDRFPDGQLYANLRGFDPSGAPTPSNAVLYMFLEALGVPPETIPVDGAARAGLYRSLVAGKRMLILLDNARDTEQVLPLLPGSSTSSVLVTSRHQLAGLVTAHGARRLTLDVLTPAEARQLLASHLGAARVADDAEATAALIRHCAGLPLALSIVAARAVVRPDFPLAAFADELGAASTRLDALDAGELAVNLRAVLSCSYEALSPEAAQVFRMLGLAPGPDIGLPAAASLTAQPAARVRGLVRQLVTTHMVQEPVPDRYRMHDLVRLYATELACELTSAADRRVALHRVLDHYVHTAYAADRLLHPHRDPLRLAPPEPGVGPEAIGGHAHALSWFTAEHLVLRAAIERAAETGFDTHTWNLAWAFVTFCERRGHWHDQTAAQRAALDAALRLADRPAQAHAHRGLALAYTWIHRYEDARAHLCQALQLFAELDDVTGQAHTHRSLARVSARQGRHAQALPHDRQALALFRAAGHRAGQANALNAVGWHQAHLGALEEALACCEEALAVHTELGDRRGMAATWDSLGYIHHQRGDHQRAITCYRRSLVLFRELGNHFEEAETLTGLGDTHRSAEEPSAARQAWRRALTILTRLGHPGADQVRGRLLAGDRALAHAVS
jgi:DNA-binding SARP family transcriptional activator/tetratricopeptide (TPR) repeat protein